MKSITPLDIVLQLNELWKNKWFLLASGNFEENSFNAMTISWGFFGIMWNKPVAAVVVRPTRYTFEFMEKYDNFTLSTFPEENKKDLLLMGALSGRDIDKNTGSEFTPVKSSVVSSPSYKEAELLVECKKMYWDDFKPQHFIDPDIHKNYDVNDYHRIYFGEIVNLKGAGNFGDG